MKKLISLSLFIFLIFSCKKNNEIQNFKTEVSGSWELEKTICGECTTSLTVFAPDNGNILVLTSDGSFERKKHDTLVFKGNYTLQSKNDCFSRSDNLAFSTTENPGNTSLLYVSIENNKLTFSTSNCYADGSTQVYRRIQ